MGALVGVPAYNSSQRLEQLEKTQAADDAEDASGGDVIPSGPEKAAIGNQNQKADTGADHGRRLKRENLKESRTVRKVIDTAHTANWIAIESLRAAMAVYFLSFVVGVASIGALLAALLSARDSNGSFRLASEAGRPRMGIRITGTAGNVADMTVFPVGGQPVWLRQVQNLGGVDLRSPGTRGLVFLDPGDEENVGGDVTSVNLGDGVKVTYAGLDGAERTAVFNLVLAFGQWSIESRED
jgi:hypothetical protein